MTTGGVLTIYRLGVAGFALTSQAPATWLNQWHHIAVVRRSGNTTGYINGVGGSAITNLSGITVGGFGHSIGSIVPAIGTPQASYSPGFIDDFLLTNVALYSANFTPPTTQATDPYSYTATISNNLYGVIQKYN